MNTPRSQSEISNIRNTLNVLRPWFAPFDFGDGLIAPQEAPPTASVAVKEICLRIREQKTLDWFLARSNRMLDAICLQVTPSDCSLLDVGCADGFFTIEAAKRGFAEVHGIDFRESSIACANYAAQLLNLKNATFSVHNLYDLSQLGRSFDIVVVQGVLYHLSNPILGYEQIRKVTKQMTYYAGHTSEFKGAGENNSRSYLFEMQVEDPSLITSGDGNIVLIPTLPALKKVLSMLGYRELRDIPNPDQKIGEETGGWRELIAML